MDITMEANNKPVVVSTSEFKGRKYLSARFMYQTEDGQLHHSKNGINIQLDGEEGTEAAQAIIDAMQTALTDYIDEA